MKRFRFPATRTRTKAAIACVVAVVAVALCFDWNWFRHPLERYLMQKSGREVRIDDLHVDLGMRLMPTVRLRGLYVENAPWAAKRPLATAQEISFTLSLKSLWGPWTVISHMTLIGADVDMERLADGSRNWRLRDPEYRGPGRIKVLTLEAHRSRLQFVNRELDLKLVATADDMNATDGAPGDLKTRIVFDGVYQGAGFAGEAMSDTVLSFRESGVTFSLRGHLASRGTRLEFDGRFADLFEPGAMDAKVRLSGPSLALLHPFLTVKLLASRPYAVEAQLRQRDEVYDFSQLKGRIGHTDLAGAAVYDRHAQRPMLRTTLHSEAADLADVQPLMGMRPFGSAASADRGQGDGEQVDPASRGRIFPARLFRTRGLKSIDVRAAVTARRFSIEGWPGMQDLHAEVQIDGGLLDVKRIEAGVAGGKFTAAMVFDVRGAQPSGGLSAALSNLRIESVVPALAAKAGATARISGRLDLKGQGNSIAAIAGSSNGSFGLNIERGQLSNLADAKLGLNFGKVISVFLRGDREIAINCGVIDFDVHDGIAKTRTLVLDTAETYVEGLGAIDLKREQLHMRLLPDPKKPGLLTRHAAIRIRGPLRAPMLSTEKRERASDDDNTPRAGSCAGRATRQGEPAQKNR